MSDYVKLLKEKVNEEYLKFIDDLKNMSSEKIVDKAYEKVLKEDFNACVQSSKFDNATAKALYNKKNSLDYIYNEWMKTDMTYIDVLEDSLCYTGEKAVKEMRISQEKLDEDMN